jgi:YidC/Oxa1 family membrane protein insertase
MGAGKTLKPRESHENVTRLYAGPKKLDILENYEKQFGWHHIDLSVDFGMYYFLTKPLFYLLHWLGDLAGNFGVGIILLTFVVRLFVFPLANTSYKSFAQLRKVSPQMYVLREKYSDNKEKLQEELVKLYEKEKVNPMAGCLPILIQIPIFFALFKVLQISVEMRHAPFFGWIKDLSAPDPTSIFNLFGLIPWDPPAPLMIGAWPCFMLIFMILQKKMSPPPQDKMQKAMMDFMPFFITYILSSFAAGLVIYWTFSNALSVIQQYVIMKSMGVEPHLFKSKEQKALEKKIEEGPAVHPALGVLEHQAEEALFGEEKAEDAKPVSPPKPKKSKKKK